VPDVGAQCRLADPNAGTDFWTQVPDSRHFEDGVVDMPGWMHLLSKIAPRRQRQFPLYPEIQYCSQRRQVDGLENCRVRGPANLKFSLTELAEEPVSQKVKASEYDHMKRKQTRLGARRCLSQKILLWGRR